MDKYGKAIVNPHDTLLDPEMEYLETESGAGLDCDDGAKILNPSMTCAQRNMYCSGVSSLYIYTSSSHLTYRTKSPNRYNQLLSLRFQLEREAVDQLAPFQLAVVLILDLVLETGRFSTIIEIYAFCG